jgi:uncharacterized damage-inducible protein DinB
MRLTGRPVFRSSARSSNFTAPLTEHDMAAPSPKDLFLESFVRETATTLKVLRAFPADQGEFRPHPRSQSARELAWTFVIEQAILSAGLHDKLNLGAGFPPVPTDFQGIIAQFEKDCAALIDDIRKSTDAQWNGTVKFFAGPGKMADFPKIDFAWFLLCDQIHHRGQYSVYLRMAGGKVPSIYGPSADEPWF